MEELEKRKENASGEEELRQEIYKIPNEASCSFEFPEGCIYSE